MSFRHKSSLSRHSKIHSKTTQCHLCHRAFRYESFLKKHLLTAHQDEDAINQPHLNTFVKSHREKYPKNQSCETKYENVEQLDEEGTPPEEQEECVLIAYEEQHQHYATQYTTSQPSSSCGSVIVHQHSYT